MIYQEYTPDTQLARYIQLIWIMETSDFTSVPRERIMPDGIVEFVFHFGTPFATFQPGSDPQLQEFGFAVSQVKKYIEIEPTGKVGIMGVRCFPWGAHHFFRESIYSFSDLSISLEHLWGNEQNGLIEKIILAQNNRDRVDIIEEFLLRQLRKNHHGDGATDEIIRHIRYSGGNGSVEDICSKFGLTRRTLERKFINTIGISPKLFSRISRFLNLCHHLENHSHKSLTEITYECGYYDQAHFIREFKAFSGLTPKEFFRTRKIAFADL